MRNLLFSGALFLCAPAALAATVQPPAANGYDPIAGKATLREFVGASTDSQAQARLAALDSFLGAPAEVLARIPGVAKTDAERIAADLAKFVNPANANVFLPFEDLAVASRGPDAVVKRTFNSRNDMPREFGLGFTWAWGTRVQLRGDTVAVLEPEGAIVLYAADGKDVYRARTGGTWVEKKSDGWSRFLPAEGMSERFDARGHLVERKSIEGFATKVLRDGDGRPTALVAANGRRITFKVDGNGRVVEAKSPVETVVYRYDGNKLVSVEKNGLVTTYSWNAENRLTGVTFPQGETMSLAYNPAGWIDTFRLDEHVITARFTGDASNPAIHGAQIVHDGETTKYEFDEVRGTTRIVHPSGSVQERVMDMTCGCLAKDVLNGRATTYTYDEIGRLTSIVIDPQTSIVMSYTDKAIARTVFRQGQTDLLTLEYDAQGRIAKASQPGNRTATYEYVDGLLKTVKLDGNEVRKLHYDEKQDVVGIVDPLGQTLEMKYDDAGRPVWFRKNRAVSVDLRYEEKRIAPAMRATLRTFKGSKNLVLAQDDLEFLFGAAARPAGKRASIDDLPGTRLAGPVVVQAGCFIDWDYFWCDYLNTLGCLIPDIANTAIPFFGLINPFVFNPKTEEFEPSGLWAIIQDYRSGKLTWDAVVKTLKDPVGTLINGSPIDGLGPPGFFEALAQGRKEEAMRLMKIWIRNGRPESGKLADELARRLDVLEAAEGKAAGWKTFGKVFDGAFAVLDIVSLIKKAKECSDFAAKLGQEGGCP